MILRLLLRSALLLFSAIGACAQNTTAPDPLDLSGDVRIRVDVDRADLAGQTDQYQRNRLRARLRFGFTYQLNDAVSFGGRLRTGNSTRSGNIDLGNGLVPKAISVDRAYIDVNWGDGDAWAGKNDMPLWRQTQLYWDNDATPEGFAARHAIMLDSTSRLSFVGGLFLVDTVMSIDFTDQSKILTAQAVFTKSFAPCTLHVGGTYFGLMNRTDLVDGRQNAPEYSMVIGDAALGFTLFDRPVSAGFTFVRNLADMSVDTVLGDQKTAYAAVLDFGSTKSLGDWMLGASYGYVEEYAVPEPYAQDDWFPSSPQIASDFKGLELHAGLGLGSGMNLVATLWMVKGIAVDANSGTRFRLDWMAKF